MDKNNNQTYQTGRTEPPKSRQGLICLLLALVIFLCGVSTALGLMNIRLFRQLERRPENSALEFNPTQALTSQDPVDFHSLGLSGETVSDFWQQYQDLPSGIYITQVTERAAKAGLQAGDILLRFGDSVTESVQSLRSLLADCRNGDTAELVIFRDGAQKTVRIALEIQP